MIANSGPSPRALHDQLVAERIDPVWASATEQMLSKRYAALPHLDSTTFALRITCRTNLCEAVGTLAPAGASSREVNAAMTDLQSKSMTEEMVRSGLVPIAASFGADNLYVAYWQRSPH